MEEFERLFNIARRAALSGERDGEFCATTDDIEMMTETYRRSLQLTYNINRICAEKGIPHE